MTPGPGDIVGYSSRVGDIVLSLHAAERLAERGIAERDVREAVRIGDWTVGSDGAWKVRGNGIVVVVSDDGVVLTAYRPGGEGSARRTVLLDRW